jgi:hypothetical protein
VPAAGRRSARDSYSGCDRDDGFAYAGRYYQEARSRDDVLPRYRATAQKGGWHDDGYTGPPPGATGEGACFSKASC